jgi:hypothetical protein
MLGPFRRLATGAQGRDTAFVPSAFRLACFAAAALGLLGSRPAGACEPPEPPRPPPRVAGESDSGFAARSEKWYRDLQERQIFESVPGRIAHEDLLWATARRVVLARIERIGSIRLRGSEGQWYKSPLVTLRAIKWLRGNPSPRALKVHYLSDNSCDFGGVGSVADGGEVGGVFLLFYADGPIEPRNVLYTFDATTAVSPRSRAALALAEAPAASR